MLRVTTILSMALLATMSMSAVAEDSPADWICKNMTHTKSSTQIEGSSKECASKCWDTAVCCKHSDGGEASACFQLVQYN